MHVLQDGVTGLDHHQQLHDWHTAMEALWADYSLHTDHGLHCTGSDQHIRANKWATESGCLAAFEQMRMIGCCQKPMCNITYISKCAPIMAIDLYCASLFLLKYLKVNGEFVESFTSWISFLSPDPDRSAKVEIIEQTLFLLGSPSSNEWAFHHRLMVQTLHILCYFGTIMHLCQINQSINQSNFYSVNIPQRSQTQWRNSQISVQQQNQGNSSITSKGHRACWYLWG